MSGAGCGASESPLSRASALIFVAGVIHLLSASTFLPTAAAGVSTERGSGTTVTRYTPWASDGSVKPGLRVHEGRGNCYTTSFANPRPDTWRCIEGNSLLDPCFESPVERTVVLCQRAPWVHRGIRLRTQLHQADHVDIAPHIWAIKTSNHRNCGFLSGTSATFGHLRANYACGRPGRRGTLWGYPRQRTKLWRIWFSLGPNPRHLHRVGIMHVWK